MAALETPAPAPTLERFLTRATEKPLLRLSTAGSVDDGKSTLIGRLLYDSKGIFDDQLDSIRNSTINRSTGPLDFSLLTDGLRAEREQGITIDVAYRYFATPTRKFILADTPGHEQYTRNMATGASTADLAIILVDARNGILAQSRRHAAIASLLGIRHLVLAVNKMDLVDCDQRVFDAIRGEFESVVARLGTQQFVQPIPVSALDGDNVAWRSKRMPWYDGPCLLEFLEKVEIATDPARESFRLPVQYVIRPRDGFRGYAGQIASGVIRPGDPVLALPSGRVARVDRIVTWDGDLEEAFAPMSVTIALDQEIDIGRGDLLASPDAPPETARHFESMLVWLDERPFDPERSYLLKHTARQSGARVTAVLEKIDVTSLTGRPADGMSLNEIVRVNIETALPLFFDSYSANRRTGAFILIDPAHNGTVAAGMITRVRIDPAEEKRRARAAGFELHPVTPAERHARYGHRPALVALGDRTQLADDLERSLFERGCLVLRLEARDDFATWARQLLDAGAILLVTAAAKPAGIDPHAFLDVGETGVSDILRQLETIGILVPSEPFQDGEGI